MNKIEILSPVHVGTGDIIEAPCFYTEDGDSETKRYNFTDILSQLPSHILTNKKFLNKLASRQSSKTDLYDDINRYVDYERLNPLYGLFDINEYYIRESGYDVSEQVKDLDKPYIPGSSIKGAVINAWIYYLVKINLKDKKRHKAMESYIKQILDSNNAEQKTIINYLFGDTYDHSEFMKALQSCLVCRDIYFDQMEVLWADRIGSKKDMSGEMPLSYKECIQDGQVVFSDFMYVDENKKENIFAMLDDFIDSRMSIEKDKIINRYKQILDIFELPKLYKACSVFTQDVLKEDCTPKYKSLYKNKGYNDVNEFTEKLSQEITESIQNEEKVAYMRIGNSTNYFSKTITLLIRKYAPALYIPYFDRVLSPNIRGKTKADKNTAPKTRTIYSNSEKQYLPGFIKIYYD